MIKRKIIFSFAILFVFLFVPNVASAMTLHPTGLIWDTLEDIEATGREYPTPAFAAFESALPPEICIKDYFPLPGNQGGQGSCVGWAVAYALRSNTEEKVRGWGLDTDEHLFSPSFIYNQRTNPHIDDGMSYTAGLNRVRNDGVCTLALWPYDERDFSSQPNDEQRAQAALFKAEWYYVRGIDNIKRRLVDGYGVMLGVHVYPDFDRISPSNPIYSEVFGTSRGGHAIVLVGYDDNMGEHGAFKFINSWGRFWGLQGYGWICYEIVADTRVNQFGVMIGFVMGEPLVYEQFYEYIIENEEAIITRYVGPGGDVVIPDTLSGYPVTEIRTRFSSGSDIRITSIVIPDSVRIIGEQAFASQAQLTRVTIGSGVTHIAHRAFFGNSQLRVVYFSGDAPTHLGTQIFNLHTTLYFTENKIGWISPTWNGYSAQLYSHENKAVGTWRILKEATCFEYGERVWICNVCNFEDYENPQDIPPSHNWVTHRNGTHSCLVPNGCGVANETCSPNDPGDTCDKCAWWFPPPRCQLCSDRGCDECFYAYMIVNGGAIIRDYRGRGGDIIIPATLGGYPVTQIGDSAFMPLWFGGRPTLTSVVIPDGVTRIGFAAFAFQTNLVSVTIPASVEFIGEFAFHHITNATFPLPLLTILCYENSFAHEYAKEENIPLGLFNPSLWGDVNGDGILNAADVTLMRRFGLGDVDALRRILAA
jgi:hypothetical protein